MNSPLEPFHPSVQRWFAATFPEPTRPQALGWPAIARGDSTLILAPTGSGKTLSAFLWAIDRVMFTPPPESAGRCRILYVSPLKALAVDVEKNLRRPIAGVAAIAAADGDKHITPAVAVRTGDTPRAERARFGREPADILITTPESLYLLLTSNARDVLRSIHTVILDEIHVLVPTKRGAHLAASLERLQALCAHPLQRIGLSATQRPLDEVARFLGGCERTPVDTHAEPPYRPVTIVNARDRKPLNLRIEVPVEDMARPAAPPAQSTAVAAGTLHRPEARPARGAGRGSIWSSIHPRLLELIRQHRSTLIFANSRRLAERLAGALNDLAGEPVARSHHGSIARAQRAEIEDDLKAGRIPALVATSSLELGIDMGAIDLVVQIEAPPSVASGLQRIGRSAHQADGVSQGVIFPKFRGDLVACAAAAAAMHEGAVESTRIPRNPLDVLAQQIVAMVSMDRWHVDELFAVLRSAAPYAALGRSAFESVLDMLSGRYPSDDFAELRPRVTWDRANGTVTAREGSRRMAVANGGTIPDRGLYGVFLAGADRGSARVGELDEEMVFESRVGDVFLLGASSWRIEEIAHDRVLVSPAPGEPGRMPFWRGDQAGRPVEFGRSIGRLMSELRAVPPAVAIDRLVARHDLDERAAENLLQYLADQARATRVVPDDTTVVVERCRDELGDWRICVLSPLGGRVHAPWSMAAAGRIRELRGLSVETMWSDDGFVVRFPEVDEPPDPSLVVPGPGDVESLVTTQLGSTALFAGKFREIAARSLLLPRRRPGGRTPLWQQRKRASDLLAVAAQFDSFPAVLETYRECLRDLFDLRSLVELLDGIARDPARLVLVDSESPSPFAASLLFGYVANYIYDGDAPLAERRAQALSVDQAQLRELLGDAELRELLNVDAIDGIERELQHLDERHRARHADGIHDLLLRIGDLAEADIARRSTTLAVARSTMELLRAGRIIEVRIAGAERLIAAEDASRYRDALGVALPDTLPAALRKPVADPLGDLVARYARTHGPFTLDSCAARFGLDPGTVRQVLVRLADLGSVVEGEFRPGGTSREWCEVDVLASIRRRSLARLRHEVEPVDASALGRFAVAWHGVTRRRTGADALLDVVEQLQGAPLVASLLETELLPARLREYQPSHLDLLAAAGEVVWTGIERLGERDGRIALYLTDHLPALRRLPPVDPTDARALAVLGYLRLHGASFFAAIHSAAGGGYPGETVNVLWDLVWQGVLTNDTLHPLRAFTRPPDTRRRKRPSEEPFRSRRLAPPSAEGRWSLVESHVPFAPSLTERLAATGEQLLARHGVLTREAIVAEGLPGGFGAVYPVLKALEERGRVRRGYFVAGLGATQFALPAAVELLRSFREAVDDSQTVLLSATDPANPYGTVLAWPSSSPSAEASDTGRGPTRSAGTRVVLVDGSVAAYLPRDPRQLLVFLPDDEPDRTRVASRIAAALFELAQAAPEGKRGLLIAEINGGHAADHPLASHLSSAGFRATAMGLQARPTRKN